MNGLISRWIAWKKVDDGASAGAESHVARVDAMLRAGAERLVGESAGRLRWRVLGAVSCKGVEAARAKRGSAWIAGSLGRHGGALTACALIAAGFGLSWLSMRPIPAPTVKGASPILVSGTGGGEVAVGGGGGGETTNAQENRGGISAFARKAVTLGPAAAIAASIELSYQREKERMLADARNLASSFAQRVTAPIAALHRGAEKERSEGDDGPPHQTGGGA